MTSTHYCDNDDDNSMNCRCTSDMDVEDPVADPVEYARAVNLHDLLLDGPFDDACRAFIASVPCSLHDAATFLSAIEGMPARLLDLFASGHIDIPPVSPNANAFDMAYALLDMHLNDPNDEYYVEHALVFAIHDLIDFTRFPRQEIAIMPAMAREDDKDGEGDREEKGEREGHVEKALRRANAFKWVVIDTFMHGTMHECDVIRDAIAILRRSNVMPIWAQIALNERRQ